MMPDSGSESKSTIHPILENVVIVMDATKEFTIEPLKWAIENVSVPGCVVTLFGMMPWFHARIISHKWNSVWALQFDELSGANEKSELRSDVEFQQLQAAAELCRKYKVVLQKRLVMGYPQRLTVVEQITSLQATWVVFDRNQRKDREFYAKKLACNMVMMKEDGGVDMMI